MEAKPQKNKMLQWHPAFFAGIQIEFMSEAEKLIFENEHQLGTKPKEIDVLIIKKNPEEKIHKNIGRIFRTYNIVEYKSPEDYLSIDDYYKVCGYACFYKSDVSKKNAIQASEITVTIVCSNFPYRLIKHLNERQLCVVKQEAGIFYIKGEMFPIQLIVASRLKAEDNMWLHNLTNDLQHGEDLEHLLREYRIHQKENLYKSVMNLIIRANREVFEEEKKMCEALQELYQDEFETLRIIFHEEVDALEKSHHEEVDALEKSHHEEVDALEKSYHEEVDALEKSHHEKVDALEKSYQNEVRDALIKGINAMIADNLEEGFSQERIIEKLQKRFALTAGMARDYFEKYQTA